MDGDQSNQTDNSNTDLQDATDPQATMHNDLSNIKRRAIEALTPLLSNIQNTSPERKFDICLSAIRFTGNKGLAEPALEAALKIEEADAKAEALVELINEIDYLGQS